MLRSLLRRTRRSVFRLLLRTVRLNDPWRRYPHTVPLQRYGMGARRDFRWYFEGESAVEVSSIEEVWAWLRTCAYARDPELFNEPDFWQHPRTFESLRKGDCEDFAVWAWRKLVEMGYDAELVAGQCVCGGVTIGHTWVMYRDGSEVFLFDPVVCDERRAIRPLDEARAAYVPEVSVDARLCRYAYAGYYRRLQQEVPYRAGRAPAEVLKVA